MNVSIVVTDDNFNYVGTILVTHPTWAGAAHNIWIQMMSLQKEVQREDIVSGPGEDDGLGDDLPGG